MDKSERKELPELPETYFEFIMNTMTEPYFWTKVFLSVLGFFILVTFIVYLIS